MPDTTPAKTRHVLVTWKTRVDADTQQESKKTYSVPVNQPFDFIAAVQDVISRVPADAQLSQLGVYISDYSF